LRQARLVETRRDGQRIWYRLADAEVAGFLVALQALGRQRYAEVREVVQSYLERRTAWSLFLQGNFGAGSRQEM
jgi:DNA-binding transcriptional ArsR family regulator